MLRLGLLLVFSGATLATFNIRLSQYSNPNKLVPTYTSEKLTCWNPQSDFHDDDCLLNFTVVITNQTGGMHLQPVALDYGDFTPQLDGKTGNVVLYSSSRNFSFDDDTMRGKPKSVGIVVYTRGTRGSVQGSTFFGHKPVSLEVMDWFEISGDTFSKGYNLSVSATGLLDSVRSTITFNYDLEYDESAFGPFGNMSCKAVEDGSPDQVTYMCAPLSENQQADSSDFEGNYLCHTSNQTVQQVRTDHYNRRYYILATDYSSSCTYCPGGVTNAKPPTCAASSQDEILTSHYKSRYIWFRNATIVLGVFFGLSLLLLIVACVAIIYIRGQEEDTPRRQAPPIRSWETTKAETRPLTTAAATPPRNDSPQWQYTTVRAAPAPPTTYNNPLSDARNGSTTSGSSGAPAPRREAAV